MTPSAVSEYQMKRFFIPGPMLLFLAGLSGRFVSPSYLWVSILVAAISVPFTLLFIAASFRAFVQSRREK
jgi:ABC-type Fe3+-siderophore transport system permease subunit